MPEARAYEPIRKRLKFRDLDIFFAVVETGSMAEAARRLNLTQPAVSEVIAQLETLFGIRLFDRSTKGVKPTTSGMALLKRAHAAHDEMRQCLREIDFLTDPTAGELHVGCAPRLSAGIMPQIVERFSRTYPRAVLHIDEIPPLTRELPGLRDRKYDLLVGRLVDPLARDAFGDDVKVETLFADHLVVATGATSKWARRRMVELAELVDERWILTAPDTWNYLGVSEAFRARGVRFPKVNLVTSSVSIVRHLVATGEFITATSRLIAESLSLKILPLDLHLQSWPAVIITLKNRTLSPIAGRFVDCAHKTVSSIVG